VTGIEEEPLLTIVDATETSVALGPAEEEPARVVPTPAGSNVVPTGSSCALFIEPTVMPRIGSVPVEDSLSRTKAVPGPSVHAVDPVLSFPEADRIAAPTQMIFLVDEWGRNTCVINEVCELIESMPRPWSAYRAFEAASARFPNIVRGALRFAVMAVLMGQRRCVNRLTNAGLVAGLRRDENGATYIELNNACADDYRNSYWKHHYL